MTQTASVLTCTLRRDGQYMITFKAGGAMRSALSGRAVATGSDVTVRDGVVQ